MDVDATPPRLDGKRAGIHAAIGPGASLQLPHPDWLHHEMDVAGPDGEVAAFASAACGSGTVPWTLDFERMEEDLFHRLLVARELSLAGSRILARQLREAAERRHGLAIARVGRSRACPLDLHSLVPVPSAVLALGPDNPDSLGWLWEHWGTTHALRHVTVVAGNGDRRDRGATGPGLRYRFWSADWSPWRALEQVRSDWPGLRLNLQPRYDPG